MTKLKFKPNAEWQQLHASIAAVALHIPSCQGLDLNKAGNDLFLDKVTMPTEQLEGWLSEATGKQAKEFVGPLDMSQEVSDFMEHGADFTNEISKPPSYFRLRQPVAAKLWKEVRL